MKFHLDVKELWKGISLVENSTKSRTIGREIAVEAEEDVVTIYRDSSGSYAEYTISAMVEEPGKVIAGDCSPLQFLEGTISVFDTSVNLVIQGGQMPETNIRLSGTDPSFFARLVHDGEYVTLPARSRKIGWASDPGSLKWGIVWFTGPYMVCTTETHSSFYIHDENILMEPTAIYMRSIENIPSGDFMVSGGENKVWIKAGDLVVAAAAVESNDWATKLAASIIEQTESSVPILCNKKDMANAMAYLLSLSSSQMFRDGRAYLTTKEGILRVEGQGSEVGDGVWETKMMETDSPLAQIEGDISPLQFMNALLAIEGEEAKVTMKSSGFTIVYDGAIYSAMAEISSNWRKEKEIHDEK